MSAGRPRETWNPNSPYFVGPFPDGLTLKPYNGNERYANFVGPRRPGGRRGPQFKAGQRAETMAQMYQAGQTLQQIGDVFQLTRERVRQILAGRTSLTKNDGGVALRGRVNAAKREQAAEQRCMARWGISRAEYKAIAAQYGKHGDGNRNPFHRYLRQKLSAKNRGVEFQISFADWWAIWQQSGKWGEIKKGGACMARFNDKGPYAVGNVYITTASVNTTHYQQKRRGKPLTRLDEMFIPKIERGTTATA